MYGDRRERFVTLREVPRRFYKFAMQHSSMIDRRLPTQVAPGNWPISSPRGRCRTELAEFAESHRTQSEMRSSTAQFAPAATREGAVVVCPYDAGQSPIEQPICSATSTSRYGRTYLPRSGSVWFVSTTTASWRLQSCSKADCTTAQARRCVASVIRGSVSPVGAEAAANRPRTNTSSRRAHTRYASSRLGSVASTLARSGRVPAGRGRQGQRRYRRIAQQPQCPRRSSVSSS